MSISPAILPLLVAVPLFAGVLTTFARGWAPAQRAIGVVSLSITIIMTGLLLSILDGGPLVVQMGGWPAPYGISVVFDGLSGLLILAGNLVAFACYIAGFALLREPMERSWYHPLFHFMIAGVNYAFITADLFNLFVAFEIVLLSSYALLCLGGGREQLSQAFKYVMLNLTASTFFVLAAGLVYGVTGTLNFADLSAIVAGWEARGEAPPVGFSAAAVMLLFVFTAKAAVFPLWFWLPDSYPTCPTTVAALFVGLLTKVGVYALLRTFPMVFAAAGTGLETPVATVLAVAAGSSMLLGIFGAIAMRNVRRVLVLALMSHIGYLIFGVALMTPAALSGAVIYMVQHMLVMATLFLCCGAIERLNGDDDLENAGGLAERAPWLATIFFIGAFSLVGVPPTSGFFGKALLLREGFAEGGLMAIVSGAGLLTGVLTLLAMARVWSMAFWRPPRGALTLTSDDEQQRTSASLAPAYVGAAALCTAVVGFAIFIAPISRLADTAVATIAEPRDFVIAVLGEDAWPGGAPMPEAPAEDLASVDDEEATP